jgi:SAM-dependent methyltransferase
VIEPAHMRDFWNARAREDAYFFVDDRRAYGDPDLERFWADGERDLDHIMAVLGVEIGPGDAVLDIGCGVGRLTRVLAARARLVYALDVSSEMLALAERHHSELANVSWVLGDGVSLAGVPDTSVDACVSHVVFQHIPDPAITLGYVAEMGRVLRPGGWSAFQVSNDARVHRSRRLAGIRRGPRGQDDPAWLGSAVELDAVRAVAHEAGLQLDAVVGEGSQFCLILARRPL